LYVQILIGGVVNILNLNSQISNLKFSIQGIFSQLRTTVKCSPFMFKSINPFDQKLLAEFEEHDDASVDRKLKSAADQFYSWKRTTFQHRSDLLKKAAVLLRDNREKYGRTMSLEMGKVLSESRAEIDKCADCCDYFAENAEQFLKDISVPMEATKSFVAFQPLGPVLAIMPWNFPLWQVFRFAAPALMAGNVALLKHASNVTQCSLLIEDVFRNAGYPEGTFHSLLVGSDKVERIIARDEIAAVTLTGSETAGTKVAEAAGRNLKKCVLELGGSDPFLVLEDADLELAAKVATQSRMRNAGQSCIAAKRFIVLDKVKADFIDLFKTSIEKLVQGDQLDERTTIGPLARLDLATELEKQLNESVREGAKIITGGKRNGANFQPTLLDEVKPGMKAFDEEMFGPIAAIVTVKNETEAIQMANNHRYGLGASVWTRDKQRGERLAREIESGSVFINSLMRSDQRLPFGGIKKSGYGRELSELGIKEFVNAKTIFVAS
jgi:succinate-semialdehyde dehydrogenase / glutarate-semialdehyde dehydrogenase